MPVSAGKRLRCVLVHGERGGDIEQQHALDGSWMIGREAMCNPCAAIDEGYTNTTERPCDSP